MNFRVSSEYSPAGDQPAAIDALSKGLELDYREQTLLGVTGSGKTFTAANVLANYGKPVLVVAHNKTLAAQLAQEYRSFFPDAAVSYFVSYYDYYQPEAYLPSTDTYIEKDAAINEKIDRLRHAATQSLLTRKDVIVVASVSCLYGLGSPEEYTKQNLYLNLRSKMNRQDLLSYLVNVHYDRTSADLTPGTFRLIGNVFEIMPASEQVIVEIELADGAVWSLRRIDAVSREILSEPGEVFIFPAKHFVVESSQRVQAVEAIREELEEQVKRLQAEGKNLEAERLRRRTNYDLAYIKEVGYCSGIENYSRHLSGRAPGEAPDTLLSYFPKTAEGYPDWLTIIDESHVTLPQIAGMQAGDASRKKTLVEHGFRLPSALDNRPLTFTEFMDRVGPIIYTSATPGDHEKNNSRQVVEQIIRPTGLIDPKLEVRPVVENKKSGFPGQVKDFIAEAKSEIESGKRVLATTLTKSMAEDLSVFLKESGVKSEYMHSEVKTLDRINILSNFRKGEFDCLVGVNLLREGLDLPEVSFIGILDADKEGFLRSETSLIQTIGRAARNVDGRVILYADNMTGSMTRAIEETDRRRKIQLEYNQKHGITPKTISKSINDITESIESERENTVNRLMDMDLQAAGVWSKEGKIKSKAIKKLIKEKNRQMTEAVEKLDFETAAILRDEIKELEKLEINSNGAGK